MKITTPHKIKAVIFDMDGVLINSEPLWKIAEMEGFAKVGLSLTIADCEETVGIRIDEVVAKWYRKVGWPGPGIKDVSQNIVDILIREIRQQGTALPGVYEALQKLNEADILIGLATSSAQRIIDVVFESLKLSAFFHATNSAEFEEFGKPHPAVFLNCAKKLGVHPNECLVIEDSYNGVLSAKSAGMKVIAIPEKSHRFDSRLKIADIILNDLTEFDLNIHI